ncbi:glyoxylate reductase/hydroxypyruvate reductase-like isoform X1 [Stegodyphus dumicola]|uniref:glyoxylate reductase/hydroxypyruvate reductase-like isoform X1 n=1 Tax=Stegodyphus dumicola TaxID=202533 RepID=UPI0015AA3C37|nr:glyoxylate reductase/hydroxypyruvate reductase-like isoform X1 [Stegodyphus dumicola]
MSKPKVLITRSDFPETGIKKLQEKYDVEVYPHSRIIPRDCLLQHIKGASGLFCISTDKIDKEVLDAAGPQLKVVATMSLGFDHIDVKECKKRNIIVCNGPNPISVSCVAEFTIGLLLSVSRRIVEASGAIKRGEWTEVWTPSWYVGRGLTNAIVGIVGMGRIGKAILERILPFGVAKVYYYDIYHPIPEAEDMGARFASFEELLENSDYVIACCNLTEGNKGLFNSRAFRMMKSSAVFINTSRGGVVDQEALVEALENKKIKAAGIDVMYPEPLPEDHKLASLPNIVVTPHIAAAEETAMQRLSALTAENIIEVLEDRPPITPVF